jgi:hypothetical protein
MTCSGGCPYCRNCLAKVLNQQELDKPMTGLCQACRKDSAFVPCPLIDREVRDEPAACKNMCNAAGLTVATVEAHEATCGDRFAACRYADSGCQWVGRSSTEAAHSEACLYRLEADYNARVERLERSYEQKIARLSERIEAVLAAVRAVVSARVLAKLSVDLRMETIADRPAFVVAGRTFSVRSCPLAKDPAIPRLKQAYGCCVVRVPDERAAVITTTRELWIHLLLFLLVDGAAIGVGTIIGTLSETGQSALPATFVTPVTQPPPWTVSVSVMSMTLLDSAITSLP